MTNSKKLIIIFSMITPENLIEIKDKFELYKAEFDRKYFYFLLAYFSPIIIGLVVLSKFFREIYNLFFVRLIIFIFVLIGVVIYFLLKYLYFKTNKNYIKFIENELEKFKKFYSSEEEFKTKVSETIKETFAKENMTYDIKNIKKSVFWYNLHKIIE